LHAVARQPLRQRQCTQFRASSDAASDSSGEATLDPSLDEDQSGYDPNDESEEAIEARLQDFLRRQALRESGEAYVAPASTGDTVLGQDAVTDQEAREYCGQVRDIIKLLKGNRDMAFNEIKLTVMIEDPRVRERRETLGIEESSGVSRDELAAALTEVAEGRIPKDRLALRELAREMAEWPYADLSGDSRLDQMAEAEPADGGAPQPLRPKRLIGRDKNEKPQGIEDLLPDWIGYSAVYVVWAFPIFIGLAVVAILFSNSLK